MKREYETRFYTHGMMRLYPAPASVTSSASIRVVAAILFRKVFGRRADRGIYHWRGGALAEDCRGNILFIDQINFDDLPGFDTRTGRFPLVPISTH